MYSRYSRAVSWWTGLMRVVAVDQAGCAVAERKDIVAGEGDEVAIDVAEHAHVVIGVAGGVVNGELRALPLQPLAVAERAVDLDGRGDHATDQLAARLFQNVAHVLIAPALNAQALLQVWKCEQA